jgi:splicing factor 3A subunit 2
MSKSGVGGLLSSDAANLSRKSRVRDLLFDSGGLSADPYLIRNHLGQFECKLCLSLHPSEANYMVHSEGRRHQENLAKRAARLEQQQMQTKLTANSASNRPTAVRPAASPSLGLPVYRLLKQYSSPLGQLSLLVQVSYPSAADDVQPRFRFMSAFEQKVEPVSYQDHRARYQYLVVSCSPYSNIAFRIPNRPIERDPATFLTEWNQQSKLFTMQFYFKKDQEKGLDAEKSKENDAGKFKRKREEESPE